MPRDRHEFKERIAALCREFGVETHGVEGTVVFAIDEAERYELHEVMGKPVLLLLREFPQPIARIPDGERRAQDKCKRRKHERR